MKVQQLGTTDYHGNEHRSIPSSSCITNCINAPLAMYRFHIGSILGSQWGSGCGEVLSEPGVTTAGN